MEVGIDGCYFLNRLVDNTFIIIICAIVVCVQQSLVQGREARIVVCLR